MNWTIFLIIVAVVYAIILYISVFKPKKVEKYVKLMDCVDEEMKKINLHKPNDSLQHFMDSNRRASEWQDHQRRNSPSYSSLPNNIHHNHNK